MASRKRKCLPKYFDGRGFYGRAVKMEKEKMMIHPYMMRLNFQPQRNMSADADKVTIHPKK